MVSDKEVIKLTYVQIITIGFFLVILLGSILLSLPIATKTGIPTSFTTALFTATSATCVTGLVVVDTFTHWSIFGQVIIATLIQIGGIGFMTVITMFSIFLKRRISLHERRLLMQSAGTMRISGIVKLIKRIIIGTLIFEGIGAIVLFSRFIIKMPFDEAIFNAIFHSISAFCNAGFDLMGKYGEFSSFTTYQSDAVVNITLMLLIVLGGLGFLVWNDVIINKLNFKKYELHSKIVFVTTFILIFGGAILFFLFEKNAAFADLNFGEKILAAFFQSISPRTAGFNTIDIAALSESGNFLTVIFMFIGGNPGSTAGGIKTTTFIVLLLAVISSSTHTPHITIFKRRMEKNIAQQASAIFMIYIMSVITSVLIICCAEQISAKDAIFETVSAIGTVGLSRGNTPILSGISKSILMLLMFGGRVGGLTLMLSLAEKKIHIPLDRPVEKILIG